MPRTKERNLYYIEKREKETLNKEELKKERT
jgi:hypothetical protein